MSIFRKKKLAELKVRAATLTKEMGVYDLVLLGLGSSIGVGIFALTGKAAANGGPGIIFSLLLVGIACALAAMAYAEFAALAPVSGSVYIYSYVTMGEIFAWIMGWDLALNYMMQLSTTSVGLSQYLIDFIQRLTGLAWPAALSASPWVNSESYFNLPAFLTILALTFLIAKGTKESKRVNNIMVIVKIMIILIFIGGGLFYVDPSNWQPLIPTEPFWPDGIKGISAGAAFLFLAFVGFEDAAAAAEETKDPHKNLPKGIFISLGLILLLYMGIALVLTGIVHYTQFDPNSANFMPLIEQYTNRWWVTLIYIGVMLGMLTSMLVSIYAVSRLAYSMSRDGLLPGRLSRLSKGKGVPATATWIIGLFSGIIAGLLPINELAEITDLGALFAFSFVSLSVLILRYREPKLARPFRCPGMPVVPILSIAINAYLMCNLDLQIVGALVVWMILGLVIYFAYSRNHSKVR